jgi:hypothetical protein
MLLKFFNAETRRHGDAEWRLLRERETLKKIVNCVVMGQDEQDDKLYPAYPATRDPAYPVFLKFL